MKKTLVMRALFFVLFFLGGITLTGGGASAYTSTSLHYEILNDEEKMVYQAYDELLKAFNPMEGSDDFYNATRGKEVDDSINDMINANQVRAMEFPRTDYSKSDLKWICSYATRSYRYDHLKELRLPLTRYAYRFVGNTLYFALVKEEKAVEYDYETMVRNLDEAEQKIIAEIKANPLYREDSPAIKEVLAHNWICANVSYNSEKPPAQSLRRYCNHSAYGALVDHTCVCVGYTQGMIMLMTDLGVPTYYMHSKTHAWNMVKLDDGAYYEVDTTWDRSTRSQKYFNLTTSAMNGNGTVKAHTRTPYGDRYPLAEGTLYTYDYILDMMEGMLQEPKPDTSTPKSQPESTGTDDEDGVYPEMKSYKKGGLVYRIDDDGYAVVIGCKSKSGHIKIPKTVTYDGFDYTVTEIAEKAFSGNKKLKWVDMEKNIKKIGSNAFLNCSKLRYVFILGGKTLKTIGKNAFKGTWKSFINFYITGNKSEYKRVKSLIKKNSGVKEPGFLRQ